MLFYQIPELSPEEKKMPIAKYYGKYPLLCPPPLQQQILDAGPMDPSLAVPAERWLESLVPTAHRNIVYGYCMMPDGSGYYSEYYITPPAMNSKMRRWFGQWVNHRSPLMPEGQGNLRYKLWNPLDHHDHKFVNGADDRDGVWSLESLDMGQGEKPVPAVSYRIDVRDYGFPAERFEELEKMGCRISAASEEIEGAGHHLVLRFSRPNPFGGMESVNQEWIGWQAKDGKILRDESTPVSEEYLKNVLIHNTVEHLHMPLFLPELYEEYHDKPMDAD